MSCVFCFGINKSKKKYLKCTHGNTSTTINVPVDIFLLEKSETSPTYFEIAKHIRFSKELPQKVLDYINEYTFSTCNTHYAFFKIIQYIQNDFLKWYTTNYCNEENKYYNITILVDNKVIAFDLFAYHFDYFDHPKKILSICKSSLETIHNSKSNTNNHGYYMYCRFKHEWKDQQIQIYYNKKTHEIKNDIIMLYKQNQQCECALCCMESSKFVKNLSCCINCNLCIECRIQLLERDIIKCPFCTQYI